MSDMRQFVATPTVEELEEEIERLTAEVRIMREAIEDAYEPGCECPTCDLWRASDKQEKGNE